MAVWLVVATIAVNDSTAYIFPSNHITPRVGGLDDVNIRRSRNHRRLPKSSALFSEPDGIEAEYDPNRWLSSSEESALGDATWNETLASREDGSLWSSFASSDDDSADEMTADKGGEPTEDVDDGEAWLDALAGIAADEVEFMSKEAERADMARQMQEMGFGAESIASTLGVATDDELETDLDNKVFEAFKEETTKTGFGMEVYDDVDLQTVESHAKVDWDDDADEPVRAQHVYVDEVTCIGCTNCAMIAQSTFFMESEHGRARVFNQWGGESFDFSTYLAAYILYLSHEKCFALHTR